MNTNWRLLGAGAAVSLIGTMVAPNADAVIRYDDGQSHVLSDTVPEAVVVSNGSHLDFRGGIDEFQADAQLTVDNASVTFNGGQIPNRDSLAVSSVGASTVTFNTGEVVPSDEYGAGIQITDTTALQFKGGKVLEVVGDLI